MSALEKIIFVADSSEPYRQEYAGLDRIREAAASSLDLAARLCLESKIEFTRKKGKMVHPLSFEALAGLDATEKPV
jgi:HD superfamily phosphohydrolase YqeK